MNFFTVFYDKPVHLNLFLILLTLNKCVNLKKNNKIIFFAENRSHHSLSPRGQKKNNNKKVSALTHAVPVFMSSSRTSAMNRDRHALTPRPHDVVPALSY